MKSGQTYDAIAEQYRDSKLLPFRHAIERYTVFQLLGDLRGKTVLDLACGEGIYARQFRRAGASAVTGVDVSPEMIALAAAEERADPIGCRYVCQDAARFVSDEPVDVVTAIYLLNYARTADELASFCRACFHALKPGGLLVGFNDNVCNPPLPDRSLSKYGLERTCRHPLREGDIIRYRITNPDGQVFDFDNYYLAPATFEQTMRSSGFSDFRWVDASLDPAEPEAAFWEDFLAQKPLAAFTAIRV
ncbi:MAG: methyltransferase domain-containing protein [Gemmatimonadota bacterium]|nr:methyltransferase domain-containing protein [Gemmatimonadota bacterium]